VVSKTRRRRALIAARPRGRKLLREMLEDSFDLVEAHTMAGAFEVLETEPRPVDLIVATLAFDESRMIEFLQAVKRSRKLRDIPFYCCRVVQGIITDDLVGKVSAVCKECGAEDFADVAKLSRAAAARALKAMLGA
jgi:response regulator RpfG family c-di-GMP phosphodiesterase